jgi:hypothetical protein
MAGFRKDQTGVAQTAANTAATMVAAAITAGVIGDMETAKTEFDRIREDTFNDLKTVVDADNELFAKVEAEAPKAAPRSGGSSSGGKTYGPPSLEQALGTELTFGAFKGVKLERIIEMTDAERAEYGYEKGAVAYLTYLSKLDVVSEADAAKGRKPNDFIASRAKVILEDLKSKSA